MPSERERWNWGFIGALVGCVVFWIVVGWLGWKALDKWVLVGSTQSYCISSIGPVDRNGYGDTTPEVTGTRCP